MKSKNKIFIMAFAGVLLLGLGFLLKFSNPVNKVSADESSLPKITVYKSPTCGCCVKYVAYLKQLGYEVETVMTQNMAEIKKRYGVSSDLESCHTSVIGDYAVEGHVPVEAITKLWEEKPNIKGISLPNMPAGSPGMPGVKDEDFVIRVLGEENEVFTVL